MLEKYPLDYDIKNFYETSKELLGTRYFFIDETLDKQQFEKFRNVFFTIPRLDGGKDISLDNCERVLIPSPKVATYDLKPQMSALEVTDKVIEEIEKDE